MIVQGVCQLVYRVDRAAKVRCCALELLCLTLRRSHIPPQMVDVKRLIDSLCMGIKGSKASSGERSCELILCMKY